MISRISTYGLGVLLFAPLVVVVAWSLFSDQYMVLTSEGFSLQWYTSLFNNRQIQTAILMSMMIGVCVSALTVSIGALAALALVYLPRRPLSWLLWFFLVPMGLSPLLVGLGTLTLMVNTGVPRGFGTVLSTLTALNLPLSILITYARLCRIDPHITEAARLLGAGIWETFRRIILPLIQRQLLACGLLVFIVAFDDFTITYYLGGSLESFPTLIYSMARFGMSPTVIAASAVIVITVVVGMALFWLLVHLHQDRDADKAI